MSDLSKVCSRMGNGAAGIAMQASIAALDGCWLELQCGQHGTTMLPCRFIAQRQGGNHRLSDMLPRFTCKVCHRPPVAVWLNETHNRTQQGGAPPGWSVQLVPFPAIEAEAAE